MELFGLQVTSLGVALSVLFGAGAAAVLLLLISGLSRRPIEVDAATGERRLASSGIENLLNPVGKRAMKRVNREELTKQLRWARINWSPELFRALPFVLAPLGFLLGLTLSILMEFPTYQVVIVAGGAAFAGWIWSKSKLSKALRMRSKAIAADVPGFISYYARVFSVQRDMARTFQEMNRRVQEHKRFFDQRGGAMTAELRRRIERSKGRGPYDSDLWLGLEELATQVPHGITDPTATVENPDALVVFALENNDPDLALFVNWLREAAIQGNTVEPSQLDTQVEMIRDKRYKEQQRAIARLTLEATGFLVVFNFPMLMVAIMAPVVYQVIASGATF